MQNELWDATMNMIKPAVSSCTVFYWSLLWAWCCLPPSKNQTCSSPHSSSFFKKKKKNQLSSSRASCGNFVPDNHVKIFNLFFLSEKKKQTTAGTRCFSRILTCKSVFLPCCNQLQYFSSHIVVHIFLLWMLSDTLWTKCFVFLLSKILF